MTVEPRTCWSDLLASIPRFTDASTLSANLAVANCFTSLMASSTGYCLPGVSLAFQALIRLATAISHPLDIDAHAAGTARDGAYRGVEIGGCEVGLLQLGNLFQLLARDIANLRGIGCPTAFFNTNRLADEHRSRRSLHHEGEAAIRVDGDDHGNRQPLLHLLGLGVELLAELHDVHALLTERRPDRRRRIGRACRHLQPDVALYFLGHCLPNLQVQAPRGSLLRITAAGKKGPRRQRPDSSCLLDLREVQLDGCRTSENLHRHLQAVFLVVHTLDHPVEIVERAIDHAHHLARLEQHLGARLVDPFLYAAQDLVRFLVADRRGPLRRATDEAEDLGHIAHQVPGLLVHFHLHQHVAGIELALALALLTVAHLDDLFGRHEDLAKALAESGALDALLERLGHAVLEIRVGVHDVPLQRHVQLPVPVNALVAHASTRSSTQKNTPAMITKPNTTSVVCSVSWRVGQTILRSSMRASSTKRRNSLPKRENATTMAASTRLASTASQRIHAA